MYAIIYQRRGMAQQAFGPYATASEAGDDLAKLPPAPVSSFRYMIELGQVTEEDCEWDRRATECRAAPK